jgi:predicted ATP-grasp superfamily ATP-dependent carboligase
VRALIVDAGLERSTVPAARALVAGGWTVGTGSESPNLGSRSKATSAWHHIEHTDECDDVFLESVADVVRHHRYETVFFTWEAAIAAVSENRDRLDFPIGYGPHAGVMRAMNKEQMSLAAVRAGLSVPDTVPVTSETVSELEPPVVIKSTSPDSAPRATRICEDRASALEEVQLIERAGGQAIAQEQLRGSLIALTLVAGESGIVSICQQVAVHSWPKPVGVTARGATEAIDPELRQGVERLLADLEWQGLAQLQFLRPENGPPRLLDINPRYYGSLALAVRAGANHPDVWARLATGRPVSPVTGRPGATFQWFSRDLRASLAVPEGRIREVGKCLITSQRAAHSLWSWSEPGLAFRHLGQQTATAGERRLKDGRRDRRGTSPEVMRTATLHDLPPTPAVLRALRTRRVPVAPQRLGERVLMKAGVLSYEKMWLAPLQDARRRSLNGGDPGRPRFLVRVDEFPYYSGFDSPRFGIAASRGFHDVMAEEGLPHLMSVVPQWTHAPLDPSQTGGRPLDDDDRALLERMRRDGVTFAQHGHTHRTRYLDPRRHSEICGRSPGDLADLLDRGREQLAAVGVSPRILVPPFNRFDAGQWGVMSERYDVITGGPESVALMGFHGGPQWRGSAVYLPCYAPLYSSASKILPAIERIIDQGVAGWIPVVLHTGWELDDDFASLRRLARRIAPMSASWEDLLARADLSRRA